ncbi:MAG: DUF4390 domain-containing protein [Thiohalocapsa sp.]
MTLGRRKQASRIGALAILMCATVAAFAAKGFDVTDVNTRLVDNTYVIDAQINYEFSDRALEALDNGVPLTLEVHVQVRPTDDWIWDASLVDQRLRYRIRYKPLSERYLVSLLPGEGGRTYVTRDAAITALGEIKGLQLLNRNRLEPDQAYEVQIRASLDVEELPLPLRPMAYLYPSWKQSSEWTKWPLTP